MQRCRASLIFLLPAAASTVRFTTTVLDGANATLNCSGCSGAWTFSRTSLTKAVFARQNSYLPATSTGNYEIINATYTANDGFHICGENQCVYRVNVLGSSLDVKIKMAWVEASHLSVIMLFLINFKLLTN